MLFKFAVRGDNITPERAYDFIEGNKGSYEAWFEFSEEWKNRVKVCVVEQGKKIYSIPITDGQCFLPEMERGTARIGVIGTLTSKDDEASTISTNMKTIGVLDGAANKEANSQLNTAAQVWEKYLSDMENNRVKAEVAAGTAADAAKNATTAADEAGESAEESRNNAEITENSKVAAIKAAEDAENAKTSADSAMRVAEVAASAALEAKEKLETAKRNAEEFSAKAWEFSREAFSAAAEAKNSADNAATSESNAKASEEATAESEANTAELTSRAETAAENAEKSEVNSSASEKTASQALADLLAMINSGDLILATEGKLPLSAIPATATQEIYTVTSEDELTSLTAQRGDLAELIEEIDSERTITKTWQCLGDASVRENWVVWGTSYAVQAGNATTANNATNANMINNHRIVEMTEEEFQAAVKDENTYYLVY